MTPESPPSEKEVRCQARFFFFPLPPRLRRSARTLAFVAFVLAVILWAAGAFRRGLVEPGRAAPPRGLPAPARTARTVREVVPLQEEAVGTVRSRSTVAVAAQVMARIREVRADAGSRVARGDLLVTLDDRELAAREARAREAVAAADAARALAEQSRVRAGAALRQAEATHRRVKGFLAKGAATEERMEDAESRFLQARAALAEADAAVALAGARREEARRSADEAAVALGHARIAAPRDGVVVERTAEPGDLAVPGVPLLVVLDPTALRLEARVREGLLARVAPGARLPVVVPAAGRSVEGTVAEIVPSADPVSRSFEVRVEFDAVPGVHPGMFGRLRVPAGTREVVAIPSAAVVRIGQLATVAVEEGAVWVRRLVTLGADLEGEDGAPRVEVLSGLAGGETVGLP